MKDQLWKSKFNSRGQGAGEENCRFRSSVCRTNWLVKGVFALLLRRPCFNGPALPGHRYAAHTCPYARSEGVVQDTQCSRCRATVRDSTAWSSCLQVCRGCVGRSSEVDCWFAPRIQRLTTGARLGFQRLWQIFVGPWSGHSIGRRFLLIKIRPHDAT